MTTMRILSVLAIVVLIFSLTHAIPSQMVTRYIHNMFNNPRYFYEVLNTRKVMFEVLRNKDPPNNDLGVYYSYGFFASLAVNKQYVLAWIAINSPVTWIYNYNYTASSPNYRCCQTVDATSCGYHPSDPTECFRLQGKYISATDLFMLDNVNSFEINFLWSPANCVTPSWFSNGVLSFHRNSSYSIINQFQCPGFSYYFTFNETRGSRVTFGVEPNETLASRFQSVQLLENKNNQGYEDLYYVPPPEISIGSRSLQIEPTTEFYNGVIIDTSIPYILLVTSVYSKVMKELQSQIGCRRSVYTANGIICSDNTTDWPSLTFSFKSSSGYAEMVLGKDNYVVPDIYQIGSECAAIYESQDLSVIGLVAQLDRNMTFDVKGSVLYFDKYSQRQISFDKYPESGLSGETKPTTTFFLVMFYFILILPVLVILAFKG
ncbi:Aspartic proteinase nepenthesin-2 [Rhynchospora pubera]|uniref:Aspartic proteinase nepenthesin-2 n=1 Tax=Rhynchospora pubera TaxID=906938 RepID=A0AAV8CNF2_9POAL|nr:Aspartic proteinase nepenthesin-2 [Rhynchospora pubera]